MWYVCFQSISPSLTSCQLSRILDLMEKWSNPVWKILFLKTIPETGKFLISLCQNVLSMAGSQNRCLKSLLSEISGGILSHGIVFVVIVIWGIFVCCWRWWWCFGPSILFCCVVDWAGFSERKNIYIWLSEVIVKLKIGPCQCSNLADGLVLPLR